MESTYRQSASDLDQCFADKGAAFNFFRAVEIVLADRGTKIEERELHEQGVDNVWFRVSPSLGFPASDVESIRQIESVNGDTATEITVNFLGLHGASSPLPSHMLETAAWSQGEEGVQQAFNDFFSHRLIWLFYMSWRKYRYFVRYQPDATDQFSDWMFALIGIKGKETRGTSGIPWAKLLTYLGVLAARTRSAEMISGVIAHAFTLDDVTVREFEDRVVVIPEDQRAYLNQQGMSLGQDLTIGSTAQDRAAKFTIVISVLSFERFRDFLPSGIDYPRLKELVEFLLKDQLPYDIELHFASGEVPDCIVNKHKHADLGWTTFLGDGNKTNLKPVNLQMRG